MADDPAGRDPGNREGPDRMEAPGGEGSDPPTAGDAGIYAFESDYLGRWVQIGVASGRVVSVSFPDDAEAGDHDLFDRLTDYLQGVSEDSFEDVDVALTIGGADRSVLETLRDVTYGDEVSVAELARMTPDLADDEDGHATVRDALAANPVPVLIPDHRVSDGPSAAPPDVEQKLRSLERL